MIDCVSVKNMRLSDRQTIEHGTSGSELIRRAARGVYQAVDWSGKVAVVAGSGNNGADGYALASLLYSNQIDVTIFDVSNRRHDDCAYFAMQAEEIGIPVQLYRPGKNMLYGYDIIVDCMLGTGFRGEVREAYRYAIEELNDSHAYVVSVDINSGMDGDTGEGSAVVRSDLTVAIEFIKNGMITVNAGKYIGRLVCVKIGITLAEKENVICNEREWKKISEQYQIPTGKTFLEIDGIHYYRCPKWFDLDS